MTNKKLTSKLWKYRCNDWGGYDKKEVVKDNKRCKQPISHATSMNKEERILSSPESTQYGSTYAQQIKTKSCEVIQE